MLEWQKEEEHSSKTLSYVKRVQVAPAELNRKKGVPEGPGRYKWSNGAEYDGEWRAGKFHGQGTYVWTSGEKYDGEWKVCPHGSGSSSCRITYFLTTHTLS